MKLAHCRDYVDFESAFAAARAVEADQFKWRGNFYTTLFIDGTCPPTHPVVFYVEYIVGDDEDEGDPK
jgi:hypothetical protein